MTASEGKLTLKTGAAAGDALAFTHWPALPPNLAAPKAVVLLSHGYAEHKGRYQHVADALNAAGYAVIAIDHWGHGASDGEYGFVPAFSVFNNGLDELLAEAKALYPQTKRFLLGHSMGGLVAAHYLTTHDAERQRDFAGVVLSGPALEAVAPPPAPVVFIGRFLSRIAPKAGLIALDSSLVSRDSNVVARYVADPLVYKGKMSARLGAEMIAAMAAAHANAAMLRLPLLVMHGGDDGLTAPDGSRKFVAGAASLDKTLTIHDGFYHEIFNDPGKESVIAGMIAWLDAH